jgi:COP9 signalosome complex subunit 5
MHARSGGSIEVMGLMMGYINGDAFIVTDAFRLPVEGTETRVNAHADADEYMVQYLALCRAQGRMENVVGWYHSHPGYGCWLSGIDVATQTTHQTFQDPFLAVVIDPDRTISAGKVEIGAFRTFPANHTSSSNKENNPGSASAPGTAGGSDTQAPSTNAVNADGWQAVPLAKAEEFGAHADKYYPLEISHYKSSLDTHLLELLWHKYWVQTLSQNQLLTNRDYGNKQILDLASKVRQATDTTTRYRGTSSAAQVAPGSGNAKKADTAVEKLMRDSNSVVTQERSGMIGNEIKAKLFNGLGANEP